jgi:hypothetical protein
MECRATLLLDEAEDQTCEEQKSDLYAKTYNRLSRTLHNI